MRLLPILITLLLISPIPLSQEEVKQRFPVIEAGNYFEYGVNQQANTSVTLNTTHVCGVTIKTWSWRYEIVNVTEEVVVIKVSWKAYLNGTYLESGGYTAIVYWSNLLFFKVFFDVTRIYEAATKLVSSLSLGGDYSVEDVEYTWSGMTFNCINASYYYEDEGSILYGYFIISKKYGLVLEKAQYVVWKKGYPSVPSACAIGFQFTREILKKTNILAKMILTHYLPYIIVAVVAIVASYILLRRRK